MDSPDLPSWDLMMQILWHFPSVVLLSPPNACSLSPRDLAMSSVSDFEQTMVLVACGPYTTSDSITYDPLLDLISTINHDRPDVCILVGPLCSGGQ